MPIVLIRNVSLSGLIRIRGIAAKCTTASSFGTPVPGSISSKSPYIDITSNICPESVMSALILSTPGCSSGTRSTFSTR